MPPRATSPVARRSGSTAAPAAVVERIDVSAYEIPTDRPEADGTLSWDRTTLLIVEVEAAGARGLGYSYADLAAATVARALADQVVGCDLMDIPSAWTAMNRTVRNAGRPGIASTAISAVDAALWDAKARVLGVSLVTLLGTVRDAVDAYGSGGFTSYPIALLERQLSTWVGSGIPRVKMKVGSDATADPDRVRAARRAIGDQAELFIDANGAWTPAQALAMAARFADSAVSWFEEPVSSDDLAGLRRVRDRAPLGLEIAAGEYGYDVKYFRRMLEAGAVDVLQADATRCGGITGFLQVGALCDAFAVPLSAHTAPSLHTGLCCALPRARHVEYFHDHARIEEMVFDGALHPRLGRLQPDRSRPGLGLEFKRADAARFRVA